MRSGETHTLRQWEFVRVIDGVGGATAGNGMGRRSTQWSATRTVEDVGDHYVDLASISAVLCQSSMPPPKPCGRTTVLGEAWFGEGGALDGVAAGGDAGEYLNSRARTFAASTSCGPLPPGWESAGIHRALPRVPHTDM